MNYYLMFSGFFYIFMLMSIFMGVFILKEIILIMEFIIYINQYFDFKLYFYMDFMTNLFLLVVSLITAWTFFYSKSYMNGEKMQILFIVLTFFFVLSMVLMVISMNLWLILFGWDGLGLVSYFLVVFYQNDMSNYSGAITVMTNRLGDVGMILSIYFILNLGSLDFFVLNKMGCGMVFFILLVAFGGFTKSAQFPFSSWLPLAMAAPTPISALVHSSTLVTSGVYLIIRFNLLINNSDLLVKLMLILSVMTMLFAGVMALSEIDFKKIIALSTLSQLGLMMMVVLLGNDLMGFFHLLTHALFKALLFLCSGIFIHEFSCNQDIRYYSFCMKTNMVVSGVFMVCSMSLMGLPFLSGFYSKDLILELVYSMNLNLLLVMMIIMATILTMLYSLRVMKFGLLMSKKSFCMIFMKNWDIMYSSLIFCFIMMLVSGSSLWWCFFEKFEFLVLISSVKLINFWLVLLGLSGMVGVNIMFINKYMLFNLKMFFLTSWQGVLFNKLVNLMGFFTFHSEVMLEMMFVGKFRSIVFQLFYFLSMMKFIMFYEVMIVMMLMIILM